MQSCKSEDPVEVLKKCIALFSDSSHWTRGTEARDSRGKDLDMGNHPQATRWCAIGAIRHFSATEETRTTAIAMVDKMAPLYDIVNTNDALVSVGGGRKKVVEAMSRAVHAAEAGKKVKKKNRSGTV